MILLNTETFQTLQGSKSSVKATGFQCGLGHGGDQVIWFPGFHVGIWMYCIFWVIFHSAKIANYNPVLTYWQMQPDVHLKSPATSWNLQCHVYKSFLWYGIWRKYSPTIFLSSTILSRDQVLEGLLPKCYIFVSSNHTTCVQVLHTTVCAYIWGYRNITSCWHGGGIELYIWRFGDPKIPSSANLQLWKICL